MKVLGIIPARYQSTRLPGKPLLSIKGKSMIQRVFEQASQSSFIHTLVVATDDSRIEQHIKSFGGQVMMTQVEHASGTERCSEVLMRMAEKYDVVVNIQGDEPFIDPFQIEQVIRLFEDPNVEISTLAKVIKDIKELKDPNRPKLVMDRYNKAIYFSRYPIPFVRDAHENNLLNTHVFYKHIGLYAYRSEVLKNIVKLPVSMLEKAESLEQLRWVEHGYHISVAITTIDSIGIDTEEDWLSVR